tara:strand:+ start:6300 stop:6668 length:369 start_codon:yes stop_codon:yes gene_type:complete
MEVERLSFNALKKILKGQLREKATCVIKFYSRDCHYCHALKEYYDEIAEKYENIHFFAFNTQDDSDLDNYIKINGVPTLALVYYNGLHPPRVHVIEDPSHPNEHTWYRSKDIINFIERYKNG